MGNSTFAVFSIRPDGRFIEQLPWNDWGKRDPTDFVGWIQKVARPFTEARTIQWRDDLASSLELAKNKGVMLVVLVVKTGADSDLESATNATAIAKAQYEEHGGVVFVRVAVDAIDKDSELARTLGVRSLPSVIMYDALDEKTLDTVTRASDLARRFQRALEGFTDTHQ
jgi:hypothetical protein